MPDIADDHAAFREAMARTEAASGIIRDADGNELNGIEAIVRGETPDVTPEPEGITPEPLTPEPVEPTDTSVQQQVEPAEPIVPAEPLTVEELQKQLAIATARLEEKDTFIGKQSSDVGELRQTVAELAARLDAQQQEPKVQPSVAASTPVTQELIDTNPALAAEAAYAQGDENALRYTMEQWKEIDPFAASSWRDDKLREQQQRMFDAKIAEQEAKIAAVAAPVAESAAQTADQQAWKEAFDTVKATHADIFTADPETGVTVAERLLSEVAPKYPDFKEMLLNGAAPAKAAALSALYALDRVGNPDAVKAQLDEAARVAAEEAAAARAGAAGVNGQIAAGQDDELKTTEELEAESYTTRLKAKPSLSKGWTGRR